MQKRFMKFINCLTAVSATMGVVSVVSCGSSKNSTNTVEGAQYLFEINNPPQGDIKQIGIGIAKEIYDRINPLGTNGANAEVEMSGNKAEIRVTYPGIKNDEERERVEELIKSKPQLVLTDFYGNPLFSNDKKFNSVLETIGTDPGKFVGSVDSSEKTLEGFYSFNKDNPVQVKSHVPIAINGAKSVLNSDGTHIVQVALENEGDAAGEWTKATKYVSSLPEGKKEIIAWLDPQKYICNLRNFARGVSNTNMNWQTLIGNANNPEYGMRSLAYVTNPNDGKPSKTQYQNVIDSKNYLISDAQVSQALTGKAFSIQGTFTTEQAITLARKINYGVSTYSLNTISSSLISINKNN